MLIVSPKGRPPKDSWGLNAYSKEAYNNNKQTNLLTDAKSEFTMDKQDQNNRNKNQS